jgi:hypothetical protein
MNSVLPKILLKQAPLSHRPKSYKLRRGYGVVKAKIKLSLCLSNQALRQKCVWESECIDSRFLALGTSWRWVVSFTPQSLHPRRKIPPPRTYPLDGRLGGPQNLSGRYGEKKFLGLIGTRTPTLLSSSCVASHYTDCSIPALLAYNRSLKLQKL